MTNEEFVESVRLKGEEWRDVVGYEGLYLVSSTGRIIRLGRYVRCGRGGLQYRDPILKKTATAWAKFGGYITVSLTRNKIQSACLVHRLVALAFIPNPNGYPEIDHINRNKQDNRVENLRWCTRSMNMRNEATRKFCAESRRCLRYPSQWKAVVKIKDGEEICRYDSVFIAAMDVGGISSEISKVCHGSKRTYKGYVWMLASMFDELKERKNRYNKH